MAPNPDPHDDRIDISLDLLGSGSLDAVAALAAQLEKVSQHLATVGQMNPEAKVQGAQHTAARMGASGILEDGVSPRASHGGNSGGIQNAHGQLGSRPDAELIHQGEQPFRQRLRRYASAEGDGDGSGRFSVTGAIDREIEIYGARERQQASRRGGGSMPPREPANYSVNSPHGIDLDMASGGIGGGGGSTGGGGSSGGSTGPSEGASQPMGNMPPWLQARMSNPRHRERMDEPFQLPQFGEFTVQNKLEMASDFLTRRAAGARTRAIEEDRQRFIDVHTARGLTEEEASWQISTQDEAGFGGNRGDARGRTGALLQMGADQSAQMITVARDARRLMDYGGSIQRAGVGAGYERAGQLNIPGTNIGITNPVDIVRGVLGGDSDGGGSGAAEGVQQRINIQRLRMAGGIDKGQAEEIVGELAGRGWVGEQGQNAAFDAIAPLVQKGLDPATSVDQMDRALRQGNTSIEEFRDTLKDLGSAAQASRMTLQEYQESLTGFAEQATDAGGGFNQGMRLGKNVARATGIAPQVAGDLLFNSPLVAGMAMQQGFLPNELGGMGTNQATKALLGGLEMAEAATAGFRDQPIRDPETGEITMTGEQRQSAQMATVLGTSREMVERLQRTRRTTRAAGRAESLLSRHEAEIEGYTKERDRQDQTIDGKEVLPEEFRPSARAKLNDLGNKWGAIRKDITTLAPDRKADPKGFKQFQLDLQNVEGRQGSDRVEAARRLIDRQQKRITSEIPDDMPKVQIEFTPDAQKIFRQKDISPSRRKAQAGGPSQLNDMLGPEAASGVRRMFGG